MIDPSKYPVHQNPQIPASIGRIVIGHEDLAPATVDRVAFEAVPGGLDKSLGSFQLGEQYYAGKKQHIDVVPVPVEDAGIDLSFAQLSSGPTIISATAREGFSVAVGEIDTETSMVMWKAAKEGDRVDIARGDGVPVPDSKYHGKNAKDIIQSGMIRVTDTEGAHKIYQTSAQFSGQPDHWQVSGPRITQVEQKQI